MRRLLALLLVGIAAPTGLAAQRTAVTASATIVEATSFVTAAPTLATRRGGRVIEISSPMVVQGGSRYTLAVQATHAGAAPTDGMIFVRDEKGMLRRADAGAVTSVSGARGIAAGETREVRIEVDAARAQASGAPISVVYVVAGNS